MELKPFSPFIFHNSIKHPFHSFIATVASGSLSARSLFNYVWINKNNTIMKTQTISNQQNFLKNVWVLPLLLALFLFANPVSAQITHRTVKGVVSSLDGPLLGATIVLKGTTIGAISNESGAFTFPQKLKENDVLVVSYLGYKNKEITINRVTSFIEPFLEDNPVMIYGALRTKETVAATKNRK